MQRTADLAFQFVLSRGQESVKSVDFRALEMQILRCSECGVAKLKDGIARFGDG